MGTTQRTHDRSVTRDRITGSADTELAGTTAGRGFNPSVHDIYWREQHNREPYYRKDFTYDDYAPAYRTGYATAGRYLGQGRRFDDLESELHANYERIKGQSRLAWQDAKEAARAAWHRVERLLPGDADGDGR